MAAAQELEAQLKRAILALQAGQTAQARTMLAALLRQDPQYAAAWVWMGKAVDDPEKRKECFSRALRLDPDNDEARLGMVALLSGPQAGAAEQPGPPAQVTAYPSPCPNCGAHLRFDIAARALRCQHCGTEHPLPEQARPPVWLGLPPDLATPEAQQEPYGRDALRCRSCGAVTELSVRTASLACPFCGSPQVVRETAGSLLIPPRAIVPFALEREEAEQALREWLGRGWSRPDDLAQRAAILDMHGVYLPFWSFKGLGVVSFRTEARGLAAAPLPTPQKQHLPVQDVLVPASFSLDRKVLRQIEPFDLRAALAFRPLYLAGWPAEVYQVALADAAMEAQIRMAQESRARAEVLAPVLAQTDDEMEGGLGAWSAQNRSRRQVVDYRPDFCTAQLDSFLHLMLPVWLGAYRYRGRVFSFAVNGQNGRAGGEAPRSATTIALAVACGLAGLVLLAMALWYLWPAIRGVVPQQTVDRRASSNLLGLALLAGAVLFLLFELIAILPRFRSRRRG